MENDKKNIINKIDDCLYAIFGGSVPPNPTQLIASPRMEELITELKEEFDCIVLDTPPLGILAGRLYIKPVGRCLRVCRTGSPVGSERFKVGYGFGKEKTIA